MDQKKIIFIVGPTAIGKSEVAFLLAQRINGEIISCDAMQVYREISIANNKIPAAYSKKIPHHLMDIVSIEDDFNVARFNELAIGCIDKIHKKGKTPIVVGGSGMYVKVLLDGIFDENGEDAGLREKLKEIAALKGNQYLYEQLMKCDPKAAAKIHANDLRRVVRALEVYEVNKTPISQLQKKKIGLWGKFDIKIFGLNSDRQVLYERINKRVDEMFDLGLVKEIENIQKLSLSKTAQGMIGIKEVLGYLKGDLDIEKSREMMKLNTRRFAKRQLTWFRADKRIQWILIKEDGSLDTIINDILQKVL